ncbi:MAG: ABC transporter ATP-binding protein [Nitrososphaerota archaeon]
MKMGDKSKEILCLHNVSKRYWLYKRQNERIKQVLLGSLTGKEYAQCFWALKNIDISVKAGEVLGVIGVNGSGKSTLLQIMAGTTRPTTGTVERHGRLTALLELGAGFHPEFTGRENIYLSGVTLGISEYEMKQRFKEIVDFAGIGEFIDQPVKLYSSGMFVRLAFSIATCVDPEILIVDEALAVGDSGFVMKCMNRMNSLREKGTAIVLVTHDLQTVRAFCDRVVWLSHGEIKMVGTPLEVTSQFIQMLWDDKSKNSDFSQRKVLSKLVNEEEWISIGNNPDLVRWGKGGIRVEAFRVRSGRGNSLILNHGDMVEICLRIFAIENVADGEIGVGISIRNIKGLDIITATTYDEGKLLPSLKSGEFVDVCFRFINILSPGDYALIMNVEERTSSKPEYYDFIENGALLSVISDKKIFSLVLPKIFVEIWKHT